jgi:hypothetical protein
MSIVNFFQIFVIKNLAGYGFSKTSTRILILQIVRIRIQLILVQNTVYRKIKIWLENPLKFNNLSYTLRYSSIYVAEPTHRFY